MKPSTFVSVLSSGACPSQSAEALRRTLTPSELSRFRALPERRRCDWLSGRVGLKHSYLFLTQQLGSTPLSHLEVSNASSGVPYVRRGARVHCSLAHSCGWGVCAASTGPVGVDLEPLERHGVRTCELVANREEIGGLSEAGVRVTALGATVWAIKEAVLKGAGLGLEIPPVRVRLGDPQRGLWSARLDHPRCDVSRWLVWTGALDEFVLAVARPAYCAGETRLYIGTCSDPGEAVWRWSPWRVFS